MSEPIWCVPRARRVRWQWLPSMAHLQQWLPKWQLKCRCRRLGAWEAASKQEEEARWWVPSTKRSQEYSCTVSAKLEPVYM